MSEPQSASFPIDLVARFVGRLFQMIMLAGMGLMVFGAMPVIEVISAANWPSTRGVILSSGVKAGTPGGKRLRTPKVVYRYAVKDVRYQGERVRFGPDYIPGRPSAAAVAAGYREGDAVEVFHDPADPAKSVLDRAFHPGMFAMPLAGFFLFLVGGAVNRKITEVTNAVRQKIPLPVPRGDGTFPDGKIRASSPRVGRDEDPGGKASVEGFPAGDFLAGGAPRARKVEKTMFGRDASAWSSPGPAFPDPGIGSALSWRTILIRVLWLVLGVLIILYLIRESGLRFG
ncbi:DUF3592 domain-containing protein [Syntrophobacter fumaroxidans]|uniref:DUF3592 domain-containing protein n=1 Tax=Syntrophobacter fumaroxidans (strain DSM 10017 / MPOB) TaxID=335543 RepID=A0LIH3_SYNFM|nr:DUF3592 domain-containing protein [Syntrophobacter fumaroxidans]ABK17225.1 hypothetical protein Sfum_1537 [Syntrophobacter fumaroxidans MPOB]